MLTDQVLHIARHNAFANFPEEDTPSGRIKLVPLTWGRQPEIAAAGPPFDLIVGSDILYNAESYPALATTIQQLSRPGVSAKTMFALTRELWRWRVAII